MLIDHVAEAVSNGGDTNSPTGSAGRRQGHGQRLAAVVVVIVAAALLVGAAFAMTSSKTSDTDADRCVDQAMAMLHDPEIVGYDINFFIGDDSLLTTPRPRLNPLQVKYSGANPQAWVIKRAAQDAHYEPDFMATIPTSGDQANDYKRKVQGWCSDYSPPTPESRAEIMSEIGLAGVAPFDTLEQACAAICRPLGETFVDCDAITPWTCGAKVEAIRDAALILSRLELVVAAPDSRYLLQYEMSGILWAAAEHYVELECADYPSDFYTSQSNRDVYSGLLVNAVDTTAVVRQYLPMPNEPAGTPTPSIAAAPTSVQATPSTATRRSTTSSTSPPSATPSSSMTSTGLLSTEVPHPIQVFQTPSGNIYCGLDDVGVECRIKEHSFLLERCEQQFVGSQKVSVTVGPPTDEQALSAYLGSSTQPTISGCMGNSLMLSDFHTVAYGTTVSSLAGTCTVEETGVRCTNPVGHGFNLARAGYEPF